MNKSVIIIQARMGSIRLPGKSLKKVGELLLIDHVINRALAVDDKIKVVLATSVNELNSSLINHVEKNYSIEVYRGSELDVRSRYLEIGIQNNSETLVRITADDPFKDPYMIKAGLSYFLNGKFEYLNNFEFPNLPIGMDFEIFSLKTLINHNSKFHDQNNKEHVTLSLRTDKNIKKTQIFVEEFKPKLRLTIDNENDLRFCSKIADEISRLGYGYKWDDTKVAVENVTKGSQ